MTRGEAHDSPQFKRLLENFRGEGELLLGDSAYDAGKNFELARKHGLKPVIKLRNIKPQGLLRRQAARDFERNSELYRMRGVGEVPFGGFANRYNSRTRCRLARTRRADSILMAIAYDVRTYMRARVMKELEIFCLIWFKMDLLNNLIPITKFKKAPKISEMMRMKTPIEKQVSEMLSSEKRGGLPHAMLDVLRVLVVYKGVSWRSELIQDLALLNVFRGDPEAVDERELDEALRELGRKELVKAEERFRGTMDARGSAKDKLISLADCAATQSALSRDRTLMSYVSQRRRF